MKRLEAVYREILYRAIEKKEAVFTQSELSKKLTLSLSVVNLAVKKLESIGAVKIMQRSLKILNIKKILYFWASIRNLKRDTLCEFRVEAPVREIERSMPNVFFTAYTAYKLKFEDVPADYSEVYIYADEKELEIIKKRISHFKLSSKNKANLIILKKDKLLNVYSSLPLAQLFVDLWNLKEWYAHDFLENLEGRLEL